MTNGIDPVSGLVNYVEEIKPYHTKVIEVLVEYIHTDCIDVTITEDFQLALGVPADPAAWGWTETEAARMFNDNWTNYQVSGASASGGYWEINGAFDADFSIGDKILVKDENGFSEYTVTNTAILSEIVKVRSGIVTGSPAAEDPANYQYQTSTVKTTRIYVSEALPAWVDDTIPGTGSPAQQVPIAGAIFHSTAYAYDANTNTYTLKAGLVFPSPIGVDKNADCGGFGTQFENTLQTAALVPNAILRINAGLRYFEISNVLATPITGANTWADILKYGVKFIVSGTADDGEYTVFLSAPSGGSPDILRVYVLEAIVSSAGAGGTLTVREWGYDEPDACVNQGQSLALESRISEVASIEINDVYYNFLHGWDMGHWDLGAYDGGPFTVIITST